MIGALILGAGRSRRFGRDKRRARLPSGQSLLAATVSRYLLQLDDIRVVLRPEDDADVLLEGLSVEPEQIVRSPEAALGMGHSLVAGLRTCLHWHGVMIALGDMPWVRPETIESLLRTWAAGPSREHAALTPVHGGQFGHPVIFHQTLYEALLSVTGDTGGATIRSRAAKSLTLDVDDAGVLRDVDRPDDLAAAPHGDRQNDPR